MAENKAEQKKLQDQDILQNVLNETKQMATSLNQYILESSSEELRRDYMIVLGEVYGRQKQVYDLMQQKGYYNPKPAQQQDIAELQNRLTQDQQGGEQQETGQSQQMQ
ncbi:MAG: spore coat protein [Bacillota bacterium]|nr:spore coat protein [Bacillota bacterium]HWR56246.1 spore coat protein [Negativicutes bacterium]